MTVSFLSAHVLLRIDLAVLHVHVKAAACNAKLETSGQAQLSFGSLKVKHLHGELVLPPNHMQKKRTNKNVFPVHWYPFQQPTGGNKNIIEISHVSSGSFPLQQPTGGKSNQSPRPAWKGAHGLDWSLRRLGPERNPSQRRHPAPGRQGRDLVDPR